MGSTDRLDPQFSPRRTLQTRAGQRV